MVVVVVVVFIIVISFLVGLCNEESTGKEYQIGKYVLEDLEFGSKEEAGKLFWIFSFLDTVVTSIRVSCDY